MSADDNVKTIKQVYEAFGRGDVNAILERLTDDVDWASDASSAAAPWYGIRHGRDAVSDFFQAFGSTMEVQKFEPFAFAGNEDEVHTMVHFQATSRATGRGIDMDLHHYFRFRDGRISFYRGSEDTAQTETALRN